MEQFQIIFAHPVNLSHTESNKNTFEMEPMISDKLICSNLKSVHLAQSARVSFPFQNVSLPSKSPLLHSSKVWKMVQSCLNKTSRNELKKILYMRNLAIST